LRLFAAVVPSEELYAPAIARPGPVT